MDATPLKPEPAPEHPITPQALAWLKEHAPEPYKELVEHLAEGEKTVGILLSAIEAGVPIDIGAAARNRMFKDADWTPSAFKLMAEQIVKDKNKDPFDAAIESIVDHDAGLYYGLLESWGSLDELVAGSQVTKVAKTFPICATNSGANVSMSRLAVIMAAMESEAIAPKATRGRLTRTLQAKGLPDLLAVAVRTPDREHTLLDVALRHSELLSAIQDAGLSKALNQASYPQYQEHLHRYISEKAGEQALLADTRKALGSRLLDMATFNVHPDPCELERRVAFKLNPADPRMSSPLGVCFPLNEKQFKIWDVNKVHYGNRKYDNPHGNFAWDGITLPVTLLSLAISQGSKKALENLIDKGDDVNACHESNGVTPLHVAAVMGDMASACMLLEAGARTDRKDIRGRTPLEWAGISQAGRDQEQSLRALIDSHAAQQSIRAILSASAASCSPV